MSLFGFDAMQDWQGAEFQFRFWCWAVLLGPVLLCLAANLLVHLLAWPRPQRMR